MTPSGVKQSGKAEVIRSQLNDSLKRLDVEYIDLYYQVSSIIMFENWYNLTGEDHFMSILFDIESATIIS